MTESGIDTTLTYVITNYLCYFLKFSQIIISVNVPVSMFHRSPSYGERIVNVAQFSKGIITY